VSFIKPETTYIELGVEIGRDSIVYPGNILIGNTFIGENCIVGPNNYIENCKIEDGVNVKGYSVLEDSIVNSDSQIGPFSHLRPLTKVGKNCKVGNFVEIKKSELASGVKASHLSYIGDAYLDEGVNVGAGTITCNYDGFNKYKTEIGKNVFIGSDTQLVAPVKIGDNSLIAAGTTVTKDVPENSLVHSRTKQVNIKNKGMKNKGKKK
jgi:bifunctional UDP-N-acetylglucosamine pyrophosphorylase/glucosamine-1-phosphate N-acetyltransferase